MQYAPAVNLTGTVGNDKLYGDTLNGGLGADVLAGQGGDDTYVVDDVGDDPLWDRAEVAGRG